MSYWNFLKSFDVERNDYTWKCLYMSKLVKYHPITLSTSNTITFDNGYEVKDIIDVISGPKTCCNLFISKKICFCM